MLALINASIITMTGKKYENGVILIEDGLIRAIGDNIDKARYADADRIIDASGLIALPGFIDAHSHIGMIEEKVGQPGNDCNESTHPTTPALRAIDAIHPLDSAFHNALAAGVTSAMVGPGSTNVVGGQFAFIKLHGRNIDRMTVLFPAALKVAFGENPKHSYGANGNEPLTRMSIAALLREQLHSARLYRAARDRAKAAEDDTFEPDFAMEAYIPILDGIIPLKAHVHRSDDILTAIRIAKEFGLSMTLDHCTEGHLIADDIAKSGFPAIVGPSLVSRDKTEIESLDFKTVGLLQKAGVMVAITTDHPVSRIQYLPLCAALAAREGLGEYEALRAITINAARICRVANRVGSLEVGKDADIILLDGSPFDLFTRILYTIVNGEVAYENT